MAKWSTRFNLFVYAFIFMRKIVFSYKLTLFFPGEIFLLNQILNNVTRVQPSSKRTKVPPPPKKKKKSFTITRGRSVYQAKRWQCFAVENIQD